MAKPWDDYDTMSEDQVKDRLKQEATAVLNALAARVDEIQQYEDQNQKRQKLKQDLTGKQTELRQFTNRW